MKKLKGLKTYISAIIIVILLIVGYIQGWDEKRIQEVIGLGVVMIGVCIRLGIADALGVSKADQKSALEETRRAQAQLKNIQPMIRTARALTAAQHTPTINEVSIIMDLLKGPGPLGSTPPMVKEEIKNNVIDLLKEYSKKPETNQDEADQGGSWSIEDLKKFSIGP
ncbi:MAG: hypothetical protein HOI21_02770 [Bacteroidetes Order II. Incertae sedis bacterium]|jgi:hypothetical protein|nr:hypothetical protein [Bacteroidetes Order II. bacterium]